VGDKDKKKGSDEEARLRTILDAMVEAVYVTDSKGRVTLTNEALDKLVPKDAVGRRAKNVIKNKVLRRAIRRARKKGVAAQVELESTLGDRTYSFQAQVSPLPGGSGVVTVLHDVTRLRAADRIRRDFVANASHEIRTPLTAIRGFAETLRDGALDDRPTALRFLTAIHRHALRLQRLAEDLTTLAQAESLQHSFDTVSTDLRAVCRDSAGSLEGAAHAKAIDLVYELPAEKVVLDVSPRALDHALINLIENAIKYSPSHTTVTVRLSSRDDQVILEVQDEGPGIAPEAQERIFERFFRAEGGRSPQEAGTGLGLSIARNMIERVGGELSLESEEGKGSTFRITLPREEDDDDDDD
jgi:two-component system phosphate regulon sensor histidine kinase PhoR